ncbi:MAG: hypothetical protein AAGG01_09580, partial [Planctomycetota bacterium]
MIELEDPVNEKTVIVEQPPPKAEPEEGGQNPGESGNDGEGDGGSSDDEEEEEDSNDEGQGEDGEDESGQGDDCGDPPADDSSGSGPESPGTVGAPPMPSPDPPEPLREEANSKTKSGGFLVKPGGRPPLLHSGQIEHICEDMRFPGIEAGSSLRILRRHLSRKSDDKSPFGPAWAFNFDHKFVIDGAAQDKLLVGAFGRVDRFTLTTPAPGAGPRWIGGFGRFEFAYIDGTDLVLRRRGGQKFVFEMYETTNGSGQVLRREGRLREVLSASGNALRVEYDDPDPRTTVITSLYDAFNREIELFREDPNHPLYVTRIRDFAGREAHYTYDADGNLTEATTPAVTSTGGLNDFPNGKTSQYGYVGVVTTSTGGTSNELVHALKSIVAPNESVAGMETCVEYEYYPIDQNLPHSGWLYKKTTGNQDSATPKELQAGGTWTYSYAPAPPAAPDANTVAMVTTVVDAAGTTAVFEVSGFGQMLKETVFAQTPSLRPGSPTQWVKTLLYTDDGLVRQVVFPGGESERYIYGPAPSVTSPILRRMLGCEANRVEYRGAGTPLSAPADEVSEQVIEPIYGRVFQEIESRGFENGASPDDYTTTYTYDYMEDLDAST